MWVLIAVAVIGIFLAIVIKKIIGKIISLVLAAALVFFCWQQRDKVLNAADELRDTACSQSSTAEADLPSFFGFDISVPDDWCST